MRKTVTLLASFGLIAAQAGAVTLGNFPGSASNGRQSLWLTGTTGANCTFTRGGEPIAWAVLQPKTEERPMTTVMIATREPHAGITVSCDKTGFQTWSAQLTWQPQTAYYNGQVLCGPPPASAEPCRDSEITAMAHMPDTVAVHLVPSTAP